jgi:hypothetical protein
MSKKQLVDELHKPARRNFKRRTVILKGINDLWQADLVEMGEYASDNNGYRYLLTVIDTFSKFAWALPVKTKSGVEITKTMNQILIKHSPTHLQTDNGKEFYNNNFQNLMKRYNINHYSTYTSLKASIVERFNRTLKGWMWKQFSLNGNYKWIDNIQDLVNKYNSTIHRTIKMRPRDVNFTNEKTLLNTVYNKIKTFPLPKFKIGEKVRISKHKYLFEKGYTPNWTTEIFVIKNIKNTNPVTYILKDYQNETIQGCFYEYELLKTKQPNIYLIQKILKQKGNKVYVKWLGFSDKHNTWIDKSKIL